MYKHLWFKRKFRKLKELFMDEFDSLREEVSQIRTVVESTKVLLANLADQIVTHKDDPAKIQEIADQLRATREDLANAVAENTPSA
jgi:phage regulator Rha-like protein